METNINSRISNFYIVGISYKKTDATIRGQFAISNEQYQVILNLAPAYGLDAFFVLSTCNRTEIYGFCDNAEQLINLLCTQTAGTSTTFTEYAYIKNGEQAIEHLFKVGSGLDSQILGDYEIVGQLKQAVNFAKERGFINCFIERLFNNVLQASKTIKNTTALSAGTVSVSFAAVQYIKENIDSKANKKVLIIGVGKIGRNTCKYLVEYLGLTDITLINRTEEKAAGLAAELHLKYAPMGDLAGYIASADIILAATNANEPTILKEHLENKGNKLIIDLSIPYNVEASAHQLSNINLVNVDTLSKAKEEVLLKRELELPKAKEILGDYHAQFIEWCKMRKNAPMLSAIKATLNDIALLHQLEFNNPDTRCPYIAAEQKIQQIINSMAGKMRNQNQQGCHYIEAINEFMVNVHYRNQFIP